MEKKKLFTVKDIVGTALLLALELVLQLLGSIIPTPVTMNLSLIPITIGAIIFGPISGAFLGLTCGLILILTPNTVTLFMSISPFGTVLTCLVKTALAGLAAGFIYLPFKKKGMNLVGAIIASIVVPLLNTLVFSIFCLIFFMDGLRAQGFAITDYWSLFTVFIGFNFLIEIVSNTVICPMISKAIEMRTASNQKA